MIKSFKKLYLSSINAAGEGGSAGEGGKNLSKSLIFVLRNGLIFFFQGSIARRAVAVSN